MGSKIDWGTPANQLAVDVMLWIAQNRETVTVEDLREVIEKIEFTIEGLEGKHDGVL